MLPRYPYDLLHTTLQAAHVGQVFFLHKNALNGGILDDADLPELHSTTLCKVVAHSDSEKEWEGSCIIYWESGKGMCRKRHTGIMSVTTEIELAIPRALRP